MNFQIGQVKIYVGGVSMNEGKIGFDVKVIAPIADYDIVIESTYRQADNEQPFEMNIGVNKRHAKEST